MKPVFITQRLVATKEYPEERECLDTRWALFLKKCGLLPIILPINGDIHAYWQSVKPEGLLLTGGNNLENCSSQDCLAGKRDLFEQKLITRAIEEGIPILGVCRGMQVLAWYFGSQLSPVKNHVAVSHVITVEKGSIFAPFYMNDSSVNSYHDFSVFKESKEFTTKVWSRSEHGIEGMSSTNGKIAGMMWHPEREDTFCQCDIDFFKYFFLSE